MARKIKGSNSRISFKKQAGTSSKQVVPMDALKDFVRTRGADFLKDPNISSVGIDTSRRMANLLMKYPFNLP
jgi:hypothetical protein